MSSDLDGSVVGLSLPFPVGLIEEEYTRFILVLYDSYIATCSNPIPRPRTGVVDLLKIAAESGDIGFLHKMKQRFGGVLYNRYYINACFQHGHIEFFKHYISLAKGTCVIVELDDYEGDFERNPSWATPRYRLISDVLSPYTLSAELHLELIRYIYEEVILKFPPKEDLEKLVIPGRVCGRMPGIPTVDKLVSNYPGYPDLTPWESEYILDSTFESKFHYIRTYLVEVRGLRYNEDLIEVAARRYCKGIYHYVLDHLLPELDKAAMTAKYPVQDPPDHRFLCLILCYCWTPDHLALQDLFFGRPEVIPKIVHVINFLSRSVSQSNYGIVRSQITEFELKIQQRAERSTTTFEAAAQSICDVLKEVLQIMGDAGYQGFTDIDWFIEGDVDFNDQPEYMRS